jgi:hypothetical protein
VGVAIDHVTWDLAWTVHERLSALAAGAVLDALSPVTPDLIPIVRASYLVPNAAAGAFHGPVAELEERWRSPRVSSS